MADVLERMKRYDLHEEDLARMLSAGRIAIGALLMLSPAKVMKVWTGDAPTPGLKHAARSLGARDIAIGTGTLVALDRGKDVGRWLQAQAISDASDALGTVIAFKHMPRLGRWATLALEAGAAYLGLELAAAFEDD